jgi:hypothetical protein
MQYTCVRVWTGREGQDRAVEGKQRGKIETGIKDKRAHTVPEGNGTGRGVKD